MAQYPYILFLVSFRNILFIQPNVNMIKAKSGFKDSSHWSVCVGVCACVCALLLSLEKECAFLFSRFQVSS